MAGRWSVALTCLLLVGCGGPVLPTATPSPLSHAAGARDVVLRMSVGGGLPYPGKTIEETPEFTLYGNGRVIRVAEQTSADGTVTSELRKGQLSAEAVDSILRMALNEGGLATAKEQYADVEIFDAATTRFEIHAGDFDRVVRVYALGIVDDSAPSARERAAFRDLVGRLKETGANAADLGVFEPEAYRVTLADPYPELQPNADWPWPELVPADFAQDSSGARTRIMTTAQGEAVMSLGITHDLVTRGPDGRMYMIRIHQLLPDEMPV